MSPTLRWIVALVAAVLIVSLLAWARGETHHHGEQIGSLDSVSAGR